MTRRSYAPRRRLVALTAGLASLTAGVAAPVLLTPAPAHAAGCSGEPVHKTYAKPATLVVGTKETKTTTLIVATRHSCGVKKVKATISSPLYDDSFTLTKYATQHSYDYWGVTYSLSPDSLYDVEAGRWSVRYLITGDSPDHTHKAKALSVRRAARLTVNATPEPVRKGHTVTVRGTFTRADWEAGSYKGFGSARVQLQFRTTDGSYKTVKTVRTNAAGALKTTVKAGRDGCYRYRFPGSGSTGSANATGDCVDVRS